MAGPSYRSSDKILCHCLSISNKSSVVVSGMHKNVMKKAMKLAYPLNRNKSFSPTKLKSIDAMSAPSLPEDADTPWHIADEAYYRQGNNQC